jgi:RNA polymerase sigma factor (sigma-70 family)
MRAKRQHESEGSDLLQRFRSGEQDALAEVYAAYVEKVGRLVRSGCLVRRGNGGIAGRVCVSPQDHPDVIQEVFVKALSPSGRRGYDATRDYGPYLLIIARNTMISWLRKRSCAQSVTRSVAVRAGLDFEGRAPWEDDAIVAAAERYLSNLPPELHAAYRHRYVENLTQQQTARAMGISRQNLRTLEQRLRSGLERSLPKWS